MLPYPVAVALDGNRSFVVHDRDNVLELEIFRVAS
jgi:hypothetical protein